MNCCISSKFAKYIWGLIGFIILVSVIFSLASCKRKVPREGHVSEQDGVADIDFYTCGMHPTVKITPQEFNKGNVNCPICNMKLTPVYKEKVMERGEGDRLKGVVSRVKIRGDQLQRAGVKTEVVRKHRLYKEIRTVGRVAYDPELAIAEQEFIASLKALDKIQESKISEIKERTRNLLESSKRKLRLLGLSEEQIKELEKTRKVHTSLILPEEKMWIYGDIYEYELSWVKAGQKIKVTTSSIPGKEFNGVISSLNPVLDSKTRSVKFRAEVSNPDLKLKPEMYVDVFIRYDFPVGAEKTIYQCPMKCHVSEEAGRCPVCGMQMIERILPEGLLAVPKSAVLDTGLKKIVYVEESPGIYVGKIVELGPEAISAMDGEKAKFYPVLKGLSEGEAVVTKANFLIDSQSQITGVAAAAYGGALEVGEKKTPPIHQH